ncbi:ABC transporter permease [Cellulomonas cellasea]|uniref:ABC transporter permease n=1 Tax=Cellulomonas cellasea TaxID=43670 RepID=UPI0025A360B7|nr:ABC transporter permease [Cellulomonas cellasea]MDM8083254.1 ABC transporter permease [Cellulomonas cellasea]
MPRMIVINPPGRLPLPSRRELWEAREVFWRFGVRDLKLRYRQTVLGVGWVVLQPLLSAGIFSIVFGRIAELPSDGVPYFVFSFAGMLCWTLFSGIVTRAAPSLVSNQALVSKVFFPRVLVPLSSVLSVAVDVLVAGVLMAGMLAVTGIWPGWPLLLLPLWIVLVALLASGIGLAASALMVSYRDIQYIVPFALQTLLYASPLAYSLSAVGEDFRWLFDLNPLTWLLEGFRWSLLGLEQPAPWQFVAAVVTSVGVFVGGMLVFSKMERGFADVI